MKTLSPTSKLFLKRFAAAALFTITIALVGSIASRPLMQHAMLIPKVIFKTTLPVDAVAITPDGKLVIGAVDNYDLGTEEYRLAHPSMRVWPAGEIYVWDVQSHERLRTLAPFNQAIMSLAVSPDGTKLAADEMLGESLWDIPSSRLIWRKQAILGEPMFSADSKTLIFIDHTLDISSRTLRNTASAKHLTNPFAISPSQTMLVTIDEDYQFKRATSLSRLKFIKGGRPHLWDRGTGAEQYTLPYDKTGNVAFSPNGHDLASISSVDGLNTGEIQGSILHLTDIRTQTIIWQSRWGQNDSILLNSLVFSPSGQTIAVEDFAHRIYLINAQNGSTIRRITPYSRIDTSKSTMVTPTGLAFSGDGKLLVSRADHAVCVWDTQDVK